MDQNQQGGQGRRGNFHRGRRGSERRGHERREPQSPPPEQSPRSGGERVDVEQIMRDIRARIAQRHGIELSNQQVQELAARRLEAILDPRTVTPALLDQLRKSAGMPAVDPMAQVVAEPAYTFEESTLFESHRGLLRFFRALLKPILKLFFNPNPLIRALNIQSKINADLAARELERDRRQTEWNALHYELLQRMVTETARVSIEMQSLSLRMEALAGKVDFNERRVRGIEGSLHQTQAPRPPQRSEPPPPVSVALADASESPTTAGDLKPVAPASVAGSADGQRRRRRRRRGRRGTGPAGDEATAIGASGGAVATEADEGGPESYEDADDDAENGAVVAEPPAEAAAPTTGSEPAPLTQASAPTPVEQPLAPAPPEPAQSPEPPAVENPAPDSSRTEG